MTSPHFACGEAADHTSGGKSVIGKDRGANLVTQAMPGLSGIVQGGDFVFYKVTSPLGFVSGTVTASPGGVASLVQTNGLPFVAFSSKIGSYGIPALAGSVNLTAAVQSTALSGSAAVQVTAGRS